jgi:hypothetical protein
VPNERLGAGIVADQDLAVVLLDLRRRLRGEYGDTPAVIMLIDRAVAGLGTLASIILGAPPLRAGYARNPKPQSIPRIIQVTRSPSNAARNPSNSAGYSGNPKPQSIPWVTLRPCRERLLRIRSGHSASASWFCGSPIWSGQSGSTGMCWSSR